jgi:hypothetical protein
MFSVVMRTQGRFPSQPKRHGRTGVHPCPLSSQSVHPPEGIRQSDLSFGRKDGNATVFIARRKRRHRKETRENPGFSAVHFGLGERFIDRTRWATIIPSFQKTVILSYTQNVPLARGKSHVGSFSSHPWDKATVRHRTTPGAPETLPPLWTRLRIQIHRQLLR